jgi:hypothetical protein
MPRGSRSLSWRGAAYALVSVMSRTESGNAEVVHDGENGYLVGIGDVAAFADRLTSLAEDAGKRSPAPAGRLGDERARFDREDDGRVCAVRGRGAVRTGRESRAGAARTVSALALVPVSLSAVAGSPEVVAPRPTRRPAALSRRNPRGSRPSQLTPLQMTARLSTSLGSPAKGP